MRLDTPFPIIMSPDGGNGRVKPLGNADYYVGKIGTTPYSNPSDRVKVYYQDEAGTETEAANPIKTNSSGAFVSSIGQLIVPYTYQGGNSVQVKSGEKLYTYKYLGKDNGEHYDVKDWKEGEIAIPYQIYAYQPVDESGDPTGPPVFVYTEKDGVTMGAVPDENFESIGDIEFKSAQEMYISSKMFRNT